MLRLLRSPLLLAREASPPRLAAGGAAGVGAAVGAAPGAAADSRARRQLRLPPAAMVHPL